MEEIDVSELTSLVLGLVFFIGIAFGAIAQRTHFCTLGALSDIANFENWDRMRMWVLSMGVAALGLQTMQLLQLANLADTIYVQNQFSWLSGLLGGLLFGFGMVLASGCSSKTLIRLGAGNLKALFTLLLLGLFAYMTLRGIVGVFRVNYLDQLQIGFEDSSYLPNLFFEPGSSGATVLQFGLPIAVIAWVFKRGVPSRDVLWGGIGIGLCAVLAWYVVFRIAFLPEHPDTLEAAYLGTYSNQAEGMSFVAPSAYLLEWLMLFSSSSTVLTIGVSLVAGVIAGSGVMALISGEFRWEAFNSVEDMANHAVGGAMMGIGGVLGMGCTVGQGLSGVSTLSATSIYVLAFLMLGGWLGLKYQAWRVEKML